MTPILPEPGEGIVGFEAEHDRDDWLAKETLATLLDFYPEWPWHVLIKGGVIFITNRAFPTGWGMSLHTSEVMHDANARKRLVMQRAGEFLERAHVSRGKMTEQRVSAIEGVPAKDFG